MSNQLTSNAEALRLFFTEDVYLVKNELQNAFVEPVKVNLDLPQPAVVVMPIVNDKPIEQAPVLPNIVEEPKPTLKKSFDFKFLGKNQRHILILVNDKQNDVSTEQGRELLRKLLLAINLTGKDFALVNYANYEDASFEDLNSFFKCQFLLSFGVTANQLGIQEQALHQLVQHNQTKLVLTTNLHDLDSDQPSKKVLWGSLQKINNG